VNNEADDGAGGRIEQFEYGYIDWDGSSSQAYSVHGLIAQRYSALGLARGYGHPETDESPSAAGGRYNIFSNDGSILWQNGASAAYEVHGDIRDTYNNVGDEDAALGFPVANEIDSTVNGTAEAVSYFQHGQIVWRGGDRSTVMHVYNQGLRYGTPSITSTNVASTEPTVTTIYSNGNYSFIGNFENTSWDGAVPENMNVVVAIGGSLGTAFAFQHSGVNGMNQTGTNPVIAQQWRDVAGGFSGKWNESSSLDAGSLWAEIKQALGYAVDALYVIVGAVG
jgi:uncharacterized protein with LGFP repeats